MRARTCLAAALTLALAAAPAALAHGPSHDGDRGWKDERADRAKERGTHYLLRACVAGSATETGVEVRVLGGNRHMRRALDGATAFTVKIDADTRIRLVGKARHLPEGSDPKRKPRIGTYADLTAGDRLIVHLRAPRGTAAADLPAAERIFDLGPAKRCAGAEDPKPEDPKPEDPKPEDPSL